MDRARSCSGPYRAPTAISSKSVLRELSPHKTRRIFLFSASTLGAHLVTLYTFHCNCFTLNQPLKHRDSMTASSLTMPYGLYRSEHHGES